MITVVLPWPGIRGIGMISMLQRYGEFLILLPDIILVDIGIFILFMW